MNLGDVSGEGVHAPTGIPLCRKGFMMLFSDHDNQNGIDSIKI
jgi:hypothetical protein